MKPLETLLVLSSIKSNVILIGGAHKWSSKGQVAFSQ